MGLFLNFNHIQGVTLSLLVFFVASVASAAMDPRFELDPSAISGDRSASKPAAKSNKRKTRPSAEKNRNYSGRDGRVYTIKPGDNLFEMLARDYGLSYGDVELFIEDIRRANNIYDINLLKSGQKIFIPAIRRPTAGSPKLSLSPQAASSTFNTAETPTYSLRLDSPLPKLSDQEVVDKTRMAWNRIVPAKSGQLQPINLQTSTFSLTLDTERYPSFPAMDGGRILLDQTGGIPPLVKSLLQEKEPSLRIISEAPSGSKRFMSSMLAAGGFYSVEENFNIDFGTDPKLTVNADFKVEKSPESLSKQDVVLINSGLGATPPLLVSYLKKEGFSLYEPFASAKQYTARNSRPIHLITPTSHPEMVDAILKIFSIYSVRDYRLDVFAADKNGISLAVKAERYFERGGKRFVVTRFDGDPVNYTLFRILETKGVRVIILEAKDDFRKISEKILSSLKIKGDFASHNLLQGAPVNYSIQMSGFDLEDPGTKGGSIFMTNIEMEPVFIELLKENGYSINSR